jgi:hypothetical protein
MTEPTPENLAALRRATTELSQHVTELAESLVSVRMEEGVKRARALQRARRLTFACSLGALVISLVATTVLVGFIVHTAQTKCHEHNAQAVRGGEIYSRLVELEAQQNPPLAVYLKSLRVEVSKPVNCSVW